MSIHKPLPTLYSKKATDKIQQWNIYALEDKKNVYLCTEYGEIGGKLINRKVEIKKTKANRSLLDEALKQAKTKYDQKVNKEGYSTDVNASELVVRPMLANKFNASKTNMTFPCLGEPKCDGNRGIVYMKDGKPVIESRNGTGIHYFDHIREEIREMLKDSPKGFYLDGELFTPDLPFNVMNGLCNMKPSTTKVTKKKQEKHDIAFKYMLNMKYYIFDCFDVNDLDMTLETRKNILKELFKNKNYQHLVLLEGQELKDIADVKKMHDVYVLDGGYEGIMMRAYGSKYELKKRSKYLQKFKEFEDQEFDVVDYEQDVDGGVVWVCETNITPKSRFNVRPKGSAEYRQTLYQHAKKYIGELLIVTYQEFTDDTHGVPRFPVGKAFRNVNDLD